MHTVCFTACESEIKKKESETAESEKETKKVKRK
jgi:hypothetical protein